MNTLTGVVNGSASASNAIATNLMRSLLTSSNKNNQAARGYFNHIGSLNGNINNASNSSINNLTLNTNNASNTNLYGENELTAYSLMPSESHKGNLNTSNNNNNSSIITATMPIHQHTRHHLNGSNTNLNQLTSRDKTQVGSNNEPKTSRDSSKAYEKTISTLRKENSFYVNSKENNNNNVSYASTSNNNLALSNNALNSIGNSVTNNKITATHYPAAVNNNHHNFSLNGSQVDTNSILNSFYANPSTISTSSHPTKTKSNLAQNRSVLSSKQMNNQTPVSSHNYQNHSGTSHHSTHHNHHHHHHHNQTVNGTPKTDCLTSNG
jgi:hypothetical protein